MLELGVDHFDFVKKLLDNRQMVYYCTRLKQADAAERQGIEQDMATSPELKPILDRLQEVDAGDIVTVSTVILPMLRQNNCSSDSVHQEITVVSQNYSSTITFRFRGRFWQLL